MTSFYNNNPNDKIKRLISVVINKIWTMSERWRSLAPAAGAVNHEDRLWSSNRILLIVFRIKGNWMAWVHGLLSSFLLDGQYARNEQSWWRWRSEQLLKRLPQKVLWKTLSKNFLIKMGSRNLSNFLLQCSPQKMSPSENVPLAFLYSASLCSGSPIRSSSSRIANLKAPTSILHCGHLDRGENISLQNRKHEETQREGGR